jgi:hypothetical protein
MNNTIMLQDITIKIQLWGAFNLFEEYTPQLWNWITSKNKD